MRRRCNFVWFFSSTSGAWELATLVEEFPKHDDRAAFSLAYLSA
ncbi:MAG TPA: hypothetical protein VKV15_00440 [Bryobacteraceae bacterium]|nr:hypothetical protein [Bryobacteraceae bacterium]